MRLRRTVLLGTVLAAFCVVAGPNGTGPQYAEALDFRQGIKEVQKGLRGAAKGVQNNPSRVIQGVGAVALGAGLVKGEAGLVIVGAALVAAPIVFQKEMQRTYGDDYAWSGCVNCNKKRVLVAPGRQASEQQRKAAFAMADEDARDLQGALKELGYYTMRIDGDFGPGSRRAVKGFQDSLGAPQTGYLTAAQRATLFDQAEGRGYVRLAALGTAPLGVGGQGSSSIVPDVQPITTPVIAEYRLAASRLQAFLTDYLQNGSASSVKNAILRPDGTIEVVLQPLPNTREDVSVLGAAELMEIAPHPLSDRWVRIALTPLDQVGDPVVLNVVDTFASADDAMAWAKAAQEDLQLLGRLTEREMKTSEPTVVAVAPQPATPSAEPPRTSVRVTPTPANAEPVGADAPAEQCRQSLYVSFSFPGDDDPINHYNITPPENTIIMDNGDSTAYVTGRCVKGTYGFTYVSVKHDEASNEWEDFKREGSFVVASNHEQCSVDLNTPNGSASLQCF